MESLLKLARKHNLKVVEDNAQSIGCKYTFSNGEKKYTGTMGNIGTTSFYPTKNLGAYGDGGAIFTNDDALAKKISMIASLGETKKFHHKIDGCNSRLDSIQAAVLIIKLN
jgi:dTDP-4-amino-4,6-dideoxygalactose transaminase